MMSGARLDADEEVEEESWRLRRREALALTGIDSICKDNSNEIQQAAQAGANTWVQRERKHALLIMSLSTSHVQNPKNKQTHHSPRRANT